MRPGGAIHVDDVIASAVSASELRRCGHPSTRYGPSLSDRDGLTTASGPVQSPGPSCRRSRNRRWDDGELSDQSAFRLRPKNRRHGFAPRRNCETGQPAAPWTSEARACGRPRHLRGLQSGLTTASGHGRTRPGASQSPSAAALEQRPFGLTGIAPTRRVVRHGVGWSTRRGSRHRSPSAGRTEG